MRKIISVCLGMLVILMLCACNAQNPVLSGQPSTGNQTASSEAPTESPADSESPAESDSPQEKVSITVQPPSGWKPVEGTVLPAQYMKNSASFMAKEEYFSGKTLDEVVDEAKQIFNGAFNAVKYEGDTEAVTIGGKDAVKLLFTCTVSGVQMKYEYVYLFAGGTVWAVTFGDMAGTFDLLADDYQKILESIRFE